MTNFLFTVDVPEIPESTSGFTESPAWRYYSKEAEVILSSVTGKLKLQKNVWLFPAQGNLNVLVKLVNLCGNENVIKNHGGQSLTFSSTLIPDGFINLMKN